MVNKLGMIEYFSLSFNGQTNISAHKFIAAMCYSITINWQLETFLLKITSGTESETSEFIHCTSQRDTPNMGHLFEISNNSSN